MSQFNFHKNYSKVPPPRWNLSIIQKLIEIYKLWHEFLPHFHKTSRYTLGAKIDSLFVEIAELIFIASYSARQEKLPFLQQSSAKLDLMKFFLQLSWEIKALDSKKYSLLSEKIDEIGKMLGGWMRQFTKENPAEGREKQREFRTNAKR